MKEPPKFCDNACFKDGRVYNKIRMLGLECGILSGKIEGLDCISFGPNLLHVHTPNERADIASVARVWEYLNAILAYKE